MKQEFSAGGIVIKKDQERIYVLMVKHGRYHEWGFPKGHVGDTISGETNEEAAIREIREETGVYTEILEPAGEETYTYKYNGEEREKTVYYFLMRSLSDKFDNTDQTMEAIEWVDCKKVERKLTHSEVRNLYSSIYPRLVEIAEKF